MNKENGKRALIITFVWAPARPVKRLRPGVTPRGGGVWPAGGGGGGGGAGGGAGGHPRGGRGGGGGGGGGG